MTEDENTPAATPVEHYQEQQSAEHAPAQETYQPAETYHEEPAAEESYGEPISLSDILEEHHEEADEGEQRPKKLSGAQRAKQQRQYLENELAARDQRIEELQRSLSERDEHSRQSEAERREEAQRKKDEAHNERLKDARGVITDFDRAMRKVAGVAVRADLIEEIKASDKSPLLTYHLAQNPDKLRELNSMSDRERAREIGRLEGSLKMPTGKKQTTAPPPPRNLKGGAAPHTALENVSDMNTFAKRLMKDLAERSGR